MRVAEHHYRSSHAAAALVLVGTTGIVLGMLLAPDTLWLQLHLSRLGEHGHLSAALFNASLVVAAICLMTMGILVRKDMYGIDMPRGAELIRNWFISIAFCWIGLAVFTYDQHPHIHDFFGYGEFTLLCSLMFFLKNISDAFSDRTHYIGYIAVLTTGLLMAVYHLTHSISLLSVELYGLVYAYAWFLSLTNDVSRQRRRF
ncbi:MAG: hypothetical protein WBC12_01525 [Candidatus Saccharimonas aalborgensis]